MPTAKKLPSGSWRVRVFSHYEIKDGKKRSVYKSFTSKDPSRAGKKEAERMAAEWEYTHERREHNLTLYEATEAYLVAKEGVLSPSTLRAYQSIKRTHFTGEIGAMPLSAFTPEVVQLWISELAEGRSSKTVSNIALLLSSVYRMYYDKPLRMHLPQKSRPQTHTPTDAEVRTLLEHVKGKDLEIAIALSAFCSLRRGEICALTRKDFENDLVHVTKSMVKTPEGCWEIKQPKTLESNRIVPVPKGIMEMVERKEDRIVDCDPDKLSNRFERAVRYSQLPHFRFHDLRHYYASTAHYLGVPDAYIMANGGWATDNVMKRVYREALIDKKKEQNDRIAQHYATLYDTKPAIAHG